MKDVIVMVGKCVQINGTFRHKSCLRTSISNEPWVGLITCNIFANIPFETNFRSRVVGEDKFIKKQGSRSAKFGIRISYLSLPELITYSSSISKQLEIQRLYHGRQI